MKKIVIIAILSFILNFIWENAHSVLYDNYMGNKITEFILLRASLGDVVIIILLTFPFLFIKPLRKLSLLIIPLGLIIAYYIELYALNTNRWEYNSMMYIVPFLNIGLTPFIQIAITGYITFKVVESMDIK